MLHRAYILILPIHLYLLWLWDFLLTSSPGCCLQFQRVMGWLHWRESFHQKESRGPVPQDKFSTENQASSICSIDQRTPEDTNTTNRYQADS